MAGAARVLPTPPISFRRLYMLPNRHGLSFGALTFVILLGAINYDNALAYLLCFLLGGLLLVAMMEGYRNLAGLALGSVRDMPAFAGGEVEFRIQLADAAARPRHGVTVHALAPAPPGWWHRDVRIASATAACLTPETVLVLRVPAPQRGWQALGRLRLETGYPLGVLGGWAYLDSDARALVYPRPAGDLPLPVERAQQGGEHVGGLRGVEDFSGLFPYRPGESPRRIHWPALARLDALLVQRFQGGQASELALDWAATTGGTEVRLSQLCRWVLEADRRGLAYSLHLPGNIVPAGLGVSQRTAALEALAVFGLEAPPRHDAR